VKRLLVLILLIPLAAVACRGSRAVSLGKPPTAPRSSASPTAPSLPRPASPRVTPTPSVTPSLQPSSIGSLYTYRLWFIRHGFLFETKRTEPFTSGIATLAMTRLLEGPNAAERAASLSSRIPSGTQVLGISIHSGVATVDLSSAFESNQVNVSFRLAQAVYTLTQFSTIDGVRFQIDGVGTTTIGGVPVQQPQTRETFRDFLPAILVESPTIAAHVSSPVTVSGTANVFEARVIVRILDAAGREIARTFTQASCGTGCRGTFSVAVGYQVSTEQAGTVEVFDASARDGSPENVQDIPVTLTP
jgi:Immunoglobulin-like domain of bacterial spore germination/Sporulation and spore germination